MNKRNLFLLGFVYVLISLSLWGGGWFFSVFIIEFAGYMLFSSTFIPSPSDSYVFLAASVYSPLFIGLFAGFINSVAVLFERFWLRRVVLLGFFDKVRVFFSESRFTKYCHKYMFLTLVSTAFLPIPFEIFRLVAVVKDYSYSKLFVATFIGRSVRFFLLASFGFFLFENNLLGTFVVGTVIVFFILFAMLVFNYKKIKKKKLKIS